MIKAIHVRDIIRVARQRWTEQYRRHPDHEVTGWSHRSFGDIRRALDALDLETCSVSSLDDAIGATGWGNLNCGECWKKVEVVLRIGAEPDYEVRRLDLCRECLTEAQRVLAQGIDARSDETRSGSALLGESPTPQSGDAPGERGDSDAR